MRRLGALVLATLGVFGMAQAVNKTSQSPYIVVLGIAQDAGFPQAACAKDCCAAAWADASLSRHVVCLGLIDPKSGGRWMFECTPDFREQLKMLDAIAPARAALRAPGLDGIFLTHGHMGHYTGLMHLGREVMGAKNVPVYAMPRMKGFLTRHGPWDQLVELGNIELREMQADQPVVLNDRLRVTPFLVPHRDEYTETVGFRIDGPDKSAVFIPDIDKWTKWDRDINELISQVDIAFIDGTFFANGEIPGRDMSLIPHPFIEESLHRFADLPEIERAKVHFTHFNHTNPAMQAGSDAQQTIEAAGCHVASEGARIDL